MNLLDLFIEFLFSQKNRPSKLTVKNYKADVRQFISWFESKFSKSFDPFSVSSQIIDIYRKESTSLSASSIDRHLSSLRKFFNFLKLEGLISKSPFDVALNKSQVPNEDPYKLKGFKNFLYVYNASHLTIKNYVIDVKQFFRWAEEVAIAKDTWNVKDKNVFAKLDGALIEEYKRRLFESGISPVSINRKLSSLRKYFTWAQSEGLASSISNQVSGIASEKKRSEARPNISDPGLRNQEIQNTIRPLSSQTEYSRIPPVRLLQKTAKGINILFDSALVNPLAKTIEQGEYILWKFRGKPIFQDGQMASSKWLIAKRSTGNKPYAINNIRKEAYAPLAISTRYFPMHKKMWFHLRHTRPNWYKQYHSYPVVHYFHFAILMVFMSAMGFGLYQNFVQKPSSGNPALASGTPVAPPRILSFQGRLTDASDNPITTSKLARFSIYTADTPSSGAGTLLWQEVDRIGPDTDGIFSILLGNTGSTCADPVAVATGACKIPQTLFAQNATLYLGVTIGNDPELTPRQQLATVAYATNAEVLQGMAPITDAGVTGNTNAILALNSSGVVSIAGTATTTFQSTGGQITLQGKLLTLTTASGTDTNVQIIPDNLGKIDLQKPILNSTNSNNLATAIGSVEVDDLLSVLATSSGQSALTINQDSTGPLISASTSGTAKFTVDSSGNGYFAGNLGVGRLVPSENFDVLGNATISGTLAVTTIKPPTGALSLQYKSGGNAWTTGITLQDNTGYVGIGINPAYKLDVSTSTANDRGINIAQTATTGTNYGVYSSVTGGATTNYGGYFVSTGATTDYGVAIAAMTGATSTGLSVGGLSGATDNKAINIANITGTPTGSNYGINIGTIATATTNSYGIYIGGPAAAATNYAIYSNAAAQSYFAGNMGIGATRPLAALDVRGSSGTGPVASISANTSYAALVIDNGADMSSVGDLITASSAATPSQSPSGGGTARTQFRVTNGGVVYARSFYDLDNSARYLDPAATGTSLSVAGGIVVPGTTTFNTVAYTWPAADALASGYVLSSNAAGQLSWIAQSGGPGGSGWWKPTSPTPGALIPINNTVDVLIGGDSTTSAAFSFINVSKGTPTASVSAVSAGTGVSVVGNGTIQSLLNGNLTIGGDTTGNIILKPNNTVTATLKPNVLQFANAATVDSTGTLSVNTLNTQLVILGANLQINGGGITSNGNAITIDSGAADSVSLGSGDAFNLSGNFAQTGVKTFSTGTGLVSVNGNLNTSLIPNSTSINLGSPTNFWGTVYASNFVSPVGGGTSGYWTLTSNVLAPVSTMFDLVVGGTATSSAKFQAFANSVGDITAGDASTSANLAFSGAGTTHNIELLDAGNLNFTTSVGGQGSSNGNLVSALYIKNTGKIGINNSGPSYRFDLADATANGRGINIAQTATTGTNYGVYSSVTGGATTNYGGYFVSTGATTDYGVAIAAMTGATSTGLSVGGLSGATDNKAINIANITGTPTGSNYGINIGTIATATTNSYGIYIGGPAAAATNYAIYSNAAAQSYFAGNMGIGTTIPRQLVDILSPAGGTQLRLTSTDNSVYSDIKTDQMGYLTISPTGLVATAAASFNPSNTDTYNLGAADKEWNNLYVKQIITPVGGGIAGYWQLNSSVLSPTNIVNDLAIGGTSTSSAKFQIFGTTIGDVTTGDASAAANLAFFGAGTTHNVELLNAGNLNFATSVGGQGASNANLTSRLYIKNDGNIGIGTTVPTALLHVYKNANSDLTPTFEQAYSGKATTIRAKANSQYARIWFSDSADTKDWYAGLNGSNNFTVLQDTGSTTYTPFTIKDGTPTNTLYLDSSGNVGIGTNSPLAALDVRGNLGTIPAASVSAQSSFAAMVVDNKGLGDIFTASSSGLNRFVIAQNGNVGIGTSLPGATLAVTGNQLITGDAITTGKVLDISADGLTSGIGINLQSTSTSLEAGKLISADQTVTYTGSKTVSGNVLNLSRALTINASAGTLTIDTASSAIATTAASVTWSHTMGTGDNKYIIVGVSSSRAVSGVTYNNVNMTSIGSDSSTGAFASQWGLTNPASGANNIVVTLSGGTGNIQAGAISFTNVNQTSPTGTAAFTHGAGTSASSTIVSTTSDIVVDVLSINGSIAAGPGAGQTIQARYQDTSLSTGVSSKTGAVSTSMTWGWGGSKIWAAGGVSVQHATTVPLGITGDLAALSSNCSVTAGSCSDSASILSLTQSDTVATGAVLKVANSGTGPTATFTGGNVGIGTTIPGGLLDLTGTGGVFGTNLTDILRLENNSTTATNNAANMTFFNLRTGAVQTPVASISGILTNNGGTTYTGALAFSTAGTAAVPTERMRINNAGNVGINTTSPLATLDVRGNLATTPGASISANTNFATLVVDNTTNPGGPGGDLITASSSATPTQSQPYGDQRTQFAVTNNGTIWGRAFYDMDNKSYYVDPAATGTSLNVAGAISAVNGFSTNYATFSASLSVGTYNAPAGPGNAVFSGNVGIGTASPAELLNTSGGNLYVSSPYPGTGNTPTSYKIFFDTKNSNGSRAAGAGMQVNYTRISDTDFRSDLAFYTSTDNNPAEYMRIKYDGNVGIGTTAPGTKLQVNDTPGWADYSTYQLSLATNGYKNADQGTITTDTAAMMFYPGNYTIGGAGSWARTLDIRVKGNTATANTGMGVIRFFANNSTGSTGVQTTESEIMRIQGNGNVGIGTTNPGAVLDTYGGIYANGDISAGISGTTKVGGIVYSYSSAAGGRYFKLDGVNSELGLSGDNMYIDTLTSGKNIYLRPNSTVGLTVVAGGNTYVNAGNLGVGTTNTSAKLHVSTDGDAVQLEKGGDANRAWLEFHQGTAYWRNGFPASPYSLSWYYGGSSINETNDLMAYLSTSGGLYLKGGFAPGIHTAAGGCCSTQTATWIHVADNSIDGCPAGGNKCIATSGQSWLTGATGDVAEWYPSNATVESGYLVSIADTGGTVVEQSRKSYDQKILGITSTSPGIVLGGGEGFDESGHSIIALSGRVPTFVSTINGAIEPGDYLTSSDIPGVAMKATKAGPVVGKALDPFNDPNPDHIGKIQVFMNVSWYDPQVYFTSTGDLSITQNLASTDQNTKYNIQDAAGQIIDRIGAFAELAVANLRAGMVNAQEIATNSLAIATENVTIGGQNIRDYIVGVVNSAINNGDIVTPIASSDVIHTNIISPLASGNGNIAIKLGPDTATSSSKLEIQNASGSTVATIDSSGNASLSGQLLANSLQTTADATVGGSLSANGASIAGTLRADRIIANDIEGLNARIATIAAEQVASNKYYVASDSGLLNTNYLVQNTNGYVDIASLSGQLAYVDNLNATFGTFTQGLMAFGPTSLSDVSVAGQLSIGSQLILADNSINVLGSDLQIQPLGQGGVSFLSGLVHIDTNGNLSVSGDLTVRGKLAANVISPLPDKDLTVQNASGSSVLSVNQLGDLIASGAGTFNKLNLNPVAPALAVSDSEIIATGSAGVATISAQRAELTIDNPSVTEKSLIYITPIGDTENQVLYLMRQVPGVSFTVGVGSAPTKEIPFNWMIVN